MRNHALLTRIYEDKIVVDKAQKDLIDKIAVTFQDLPEVSKGLECNLLIHPDDAHRLHLIDQQKVKVFTSTGSIIISLKLTEDVQKGVVCMPHGWGHHKKGAILKHALLNPGASLNDLINQNAIDQLSGTSKLNGTRVKICQS